MRHDCVAKLKVLAFPDIEKAKEEANLNERWNFPKFQEIGKATHRNSTHEDHKPACLCLLWRAVKGF
jgi:hypothetical protein